MQNRIAKKISELRTTGRKAIIPYMTPEYPLRGSTLPMLRALHRAGADMIEVGIPFSDPLADGPTIQHSSMVAIKNGSTLRGILASIKEFRMESEVPVILMGYSNPLLHFGIEKFCRDAATAGVDGMIVPDLPPEEAESLRTEAHAAGLSMIFLIAPTSPPERIRTLDALSSDFTYCVSMTGVTGSYHNLEDDQKFRIFMENIQHNTTKPFVVGFGISSREDVERVWQYADGAVVGSALIRAVGNCQSIDEITLHAGTFLTALRSGITPTKEGSAT
jgi:tryptophan synthase alpha chain